MQLEQFLTV